MIDVNRLTRRYENFTAVDELSFHIERGEVVGLLGHNGAGKTTIMKMLTGYLEPTSGSIHVDGLEMGIATRQIQAKIGYLPENCPLWPEMTAIDYLDFHAVLRGIPSHQKNTLIRQAIQRTALNEKALQPIATLSRGYRQRLGVAQAILHHPDIIILDEPTNGLDPTQIRHMRSLIETLSQEATVIISTHILHEVQAVCQRVLILRSGQVAIDARLQELQKGSNLIITVGQACIPLLEKMAAVQSVTLRSSQDGRFTYVLQAASEHAPQVAQAVTEAGIPLFSLQPERHDLETVFAQVNETPSAREETHHG